VNVVAYREDELGKICSVDCQATRFGGSTYGNQSPRSMHIAIGERILHHSLKAFTYCYTSHNALTKGTGCK
jgi:hypothetical protein